MLNMRERYRLSKPSRASDQAEVLETGNKRGIHEATRGQKLT